MASANRKSTMIMLMVRKGLFSTKMPFNSFWDHIMFFFLIFYEDGLILSIESTNTLNTGPRKRVPERWDLGRK